MNVSSALPTELCKYMYMISVGVGYLFFFNLQWSSMERYKNTFVNLISAVSSAIKDLWSDRGNGNHGNAVPFRTDQASRDEVKQTHNPDVSLFIDLSGSLS